MRPIKAPERTLKTTDHNLFRGSLVHCAGRRLAVIHQHMKQLLTLITGLFLLTSVTTCKPIRFLNATTSKPDEVQRVEMAYGKLARQSMLVYTPPNPRATVFFFYGGSWIKGKASEYEFVGRTLSKRGLQVVIPDYRLYPDVQYPVFLEDSAEAVTTAICTPGLIKTGKWVAMGHSAGAYNAAMLALDPDWMEAFMAAIDGDPKRGSAFDAWIGLSGPYDFLPTDSALLNGIFTAGGQGSDTQPVNHVSAGDPPAMLVHGLEDDTVRISNSKSMARHYEEQQLRVQTQYYPDTSHAATLIAFSGLGKPTDNEVVADVIRYVDQQTGSNKSRWQTGCP